MTWQANVGPADRVVRLVVGASLVVFAIAGLFAGAWRYVAGAVGGGVAVTALIGYCPLYRVLGLGWREPARPGGADEGQQR